VAPRGNTREGRSRILWRLKQTLHELNVIHAYRIGFGFQPCPDVGALRENVAVRVPSPWRSRSLLSSELGDDLTKRPLATGVTGTGLEHRMRWAHP
jgi:hypothetical protein